MKKLRRLLALASLAAAAAAAASPAAAQTTPDTSPPRIVKLTGAVQVPMVGGGLPIVEAMIDGKGPFLLGVETGAPFSAINRDAATRLGIAANADTARADSIRIGGLLLGDLNIAILPRSPRGVDGILGLSAYHDLLLTLDYPKRTVRFERGALPDPDGETILPLTHIQEFWGLPVSYAGHEIATLIDTRSETGFAADPQLEQVLPWVAPPRVAGMAGGAGIPTSQVKQGELNGEVVVGRYHMKGASLTLHQLPPGFPSAPRIGHRVLSNFVMTLDQAHARVRLTREGPATFSLTTGPPPAHGGGAAAGLAEYVGQYGERTIGLRDGALTLTRAGGTELRLLETGKDQFGIERIPVAKLEFARDSSGKVSVLRVMTSPGV